MTQLDNQANDNIVISSLKHDYIVVKNSILVMSKKLNTHGDVDMKLYSDITEKRILINSIERVLREKMPPQDYVNFMKQIAMCYDD